MQAFRQQGHSEDAIARIECSSSEREAPWNILAGSLNPDT